MLKKIIETIPKVLPAVALAGAFTFGLTYKTNHEIDGVKFQQGYSIFNKIIEYKGEDKIRYSESLNRYSDLGKVVINGERFYPEDISVFKEAEKRYEYLKNKLDSKKSEKQQQRIEKREDEKNKRTQEALRILRK